MRGNAETTRLAWWTRLLAWWTRLRPGGGADRLRDLTVMPPRAIWRHEEHDFSVWIAANIAVIARTVGLPGLSVIAMEQPVGPFFADIVARDGAGRVVVIENQLETSDHDHLGKLLTYVSNLDARVAIWIVPAVREEHRRAIQWLNARIGTGLDCYLMTVEVVRIDRAIAPRFMLIVGPEKPRGTKPSTMGIRVRRGRQSP